MLLNKQIVELEFNIAQLGGSSVRHVCPFKSCFDCVFQLALYGSIGPLDVHKQSGLLLLII